MKRWLLVAGAVMGLLVLSWAFVSNSQPKPLAAEDNSTQRIIQGKGSQSTDTVKTLVKPEPLKLKVILRKHYIDGVTETTKKEETIWSMMDFWATYEDWTVEEQHIDTVVFQRHVEDISPLTKQQGYFGLTENGELAVFQGLPDNGKVMESFKPIPVKPLESKREKELETGIKIKDQRHFEQVLQQYSEEGEV